MTDMPFDETLKKIEQEVAAMADEKARIEALNNLTHLKEYSSDDRIISSEELTTMMENEPPLHKVMTGIKSLDELLEGFTYEEFIILSAQEKSGKTAFMLYLVHKLRAENPCCFFFEQSPKQLIRQFKSKDQTIPFFYTPAQNVENGLQWIFDRSLEAMVKHGSRIIMIDNFDWIEEGYKHKNQTSEELYRSILKDLKNFCKRWGVIIILAAHTVKMPVEQIPQPNDIKGSGAFKQIADTVLIMWRKTEKLSVDGSKTHLRTNNVALHVAENRRVGKEGYVQLVYKDNTYIEEDWSLDLSAQKEFDKY